MVFNHIRRFSSALYITGDKARKTFAVLTPVIDFEETLKNRDEFIENIKIRQLNIDFDHIERRWEFFKFVDHRKQVLEHTKSEIGRVITELMKDEENNSGDIEKLKIHSKNVKNDIKNVKDSYYGIEEGAMLKILSLPNILHKKTPKNNHEIIYEYLEKPVQNNPKSHMKIAENNKIIKYISPLYCFLEGNAALFELNTQDCFKKMLLTSGYTQFSNSDFSRSVIVEGCGTNFCDKNKVFTLQNPHEKSDEVSRLHLTGAGSIYSFLTYFARHYILQTQFPLKYFSIGRNYEPKSGNDLFNLCQSSVVNLFTATLEEEDSLENVIENVKIIYQELGYHFRMILIPANKLEISESLRVSIQMYSNFLNEYIEVGNISCYENYLSKRLLFTYSENKERKYPNIIYGNILNVQKMIGCILENNKTI